MLLSPRMLNVIVTITNRIGVVKLSVVSREQNLFRNSKVPVESEAGGPSFTGLDKMEDLYNKVKLYANIEITNCLLQKNTPRYREVADLIQDMKNECTIFKQQV